MTDATQQAAPLIGSRQFNIGDITLTVVADGRRVIPVPEGLVKNASLDAVAQALEAGGSPKGTVPFFFNPAVIDCGGRKTWSRPLTRPCQASRSLPRPATRRGIRR